MCKEKTEDKWSSEMVEFDRHSMHAKYNGSTVLGWVDHMVFLLGYIRSKVFWICWDYGNSRYMYTLILDAKWYGVLVYPVCNHILRAYVRCLLQLSRTSSLIL